jgi:DHA1 family bicyclomycin/chloramphenicol resistance-like MFS transporter
VFWFLAALGLAVWIIALRALPETLPPVGRQSADPRVIARAYGHALTNVRFMLLVAVTFLSFGGFFLYVASSPAILYTHLGMGADQFGWLFVPLVAGMMLGAFLSGRLSGHWSATRTVAAGFVLTLFAAVANVFIALLAPAQLVLVVAPVMVYACGMSLAMPSVTLAALELYPAHRGLASAVQGGLQTSSNALVAGLLAPLLAGRLSHLALGMLTLAATSALLWIGWRRMPSLPPGTAP